MLELHDLIPYIFTIGLICTVSYAYIAHLYCGVTKYWLDYEGGSLWSDTISSPQLCIHIRQLSGHLSRVIRRREAPDDDISACHTSLKLKKNIQRGGALWSHSRDSHPDQFRYGF
ncbi:hypothetical protein [Paenibacillus massiliensis]|uniref:hypothetical protein n=1 Tax=Paenibacillus massiliensis TaxID=225917 RepID=UPI0004247D1B|nr:hypothetical protein [Paenibacillus massiliensis]